ncbi:hypothetical protein AALO_G00020120 [Alosa alosa]|uniref:DDE Tnp4 domain-containing protein n=1 Tax=Alosa alosa TaxID=278164 RepID=A0AAV6HNB0_9TELE|nr:hypothetical protein AALO_G00020120 [Alosa alosa]
MFQMHSVGEQAPYDEEDSFVNRKNFHSINTQVVCDATLRVIDLVAMWPGSTHDSFMLMNSVTGIKFTEGEMPDGWLIGDSGYPLRPWLMTPILHPATEAEQRYSRSQSGLMQMFSRITTASKAGVSNTRPAGQIRPASCPIPARDV